MQVRLLDKQVQKIVKAEAKLRNCSYARAVSALVSAYALMKEMGKS